MKQWELRGVTVDIRGVRPGPETPVVHDDSIRMLVDQLPAVFWTTDQDLQFTSSFGADLDVLGLGPNQLVGSHLTDFFAPTSSAVRAHHRAMAGHSAAFELRWGHRLLRGRVAPLNDASGRRMGVVAVAQDETPIVLEGSGASRLAVAW